MTLFLKNVLCLLLAACILLPTVKQLGHALYEHEELQCDSDTTMHFHQVELDCDFQKFKLSPQQYPDFVNIQKVEIPFTKENDWNHYFFLSKYQKLHFDLRGPPIS